MNMSCDECVTEAAAVGRFGLHGLHGHHAESLWTPRAPVLAGRATSRAQRAGGPCVCRSGAWASGSPSKRAHVAAASAELLRGLSA